MGKKRIQPRVRAETIGIILGRNEAFQKEHYGIRLTSGDWLTEGIGLVANDLKLMEINWYDLSMLPDSLFCDDSMYQKVADYREKKDDDRELFVLEDSDLKVLEGLIIDDISRYFPALLTERVYTNFAIALVMRYLVLPSSEREMITSKRGGA